MVLPLIFPRRRLDENVTVGHCDSTLKLQSSLKVLTCLSLALYAAINLSNDNEVITELSRSLSVTNGLSSDDYLRESVVQAMKKTPGWKDADGKNGRRKLNINDMYIFAPREEYERLRELYEKDPASMPSPYHNMMSPQTISSLKLPPLESKRSYIKQYDATHVITTLKHFNRDGFILHYSGVTDNFSIFLPESEEISQLTEYHAQKIDETLVRILRTDFPDRFDKGQPDFSVVLSAGDSPKVDCECVPLPHSREGKLPLPEELITKNISKGLKVCNRYDFSPIWNFASGYVNPEIIPTLITFPPWGYHHFECFQTYRFGYRVCNEFLESSTRHPFGKLYFGNHEVEIGSEESSDESQLPLDHDGFIEHSVSRDIQNYKGKSGTSPKAIPVWDYLKPQVMWRGSDFCFLLCVRKGNYRYNLKPEDIPGENTADGLMNGLREMWDALSPRWKAVTWSLEEEVQLAELKQAYGREFESFPWIDAKFTDKHRGPDETDNWHHFQELGGDVVSEHMRWEEAFVYKYHTDFGGGGGTTWLGVESKLALPGVLLHHETQAYDWFHEDLIPYVHYIPVSVDLEDLRHKFEWAETHQKEAKTISDAGTAFMRYMGTMEYWERMYDRLFLRRMGPTINTYNQGGLMPGEKSFLALAEKMKFPLKKVEINIV